MLRNLSSDVLECLRHADDCAAQTKYQTDPALQRDYFDLELRWLKLARSYQFAQQPQTFASHNGQPSGELTQRLEQLKRKLASRHPPDLLKEA
jgi:hypothetical protein